MMVARCSKVCPREVPWPAVISSAIDICQRQRSEHCVQAGNDPVQTGFFAVSHVRSRMQDKKWKTELIRSAQFFCRARGSIFPEIPDSWRLG